MKLYSLTKSYQEVLDLIEEGAMDLTDTLESITDAVEDKVENIAKLVKTLEAEAAGIKVEEQRLADRRKSRENHAKRLKEYAEGAMLQTGQKKIKGPLFTIAIQKNPPSVNISDESLIPKAYFVEQAPTLNKKEVLQDLKLGLPIPGAEIKQTESLRIR